MRYPSPVFLLVILISFSCERAPDGPSNELKTMRLTNTAMRKIVDLQLNEAIWTDEQRGRNNEKWVNQLKGLASSRKDLDIQNLLAVEAHMSVLKSLAMEMDEVLQLENSFDRVAHYLQSARENSSNREMMQAEISHVELELVQQISRQLGIIDCCFASPIKVQTNGDAASGEIFEMAIFPNGERTLWGHASYDYRDIYLTQSGNKEFVEIEKNRIGHVMILRFTIANTGTYMLHFSVSESGDFQKEPVLKDFQWPVEVH